MVRDTFETLTITFIVDEELQNYRELWDWMVGIGASKSHDQWTSVLSEGDGAVRQFGTNDKDPRTKLTYEESNLYSDATLILYNSKNMAKVNVQFKNMFPTSLSGLDYSQELTDVEYFHATASFRYLYYEFENSV